MNTRITLRWVGRWDGRTHVYRLVRIIRNQRPPRTCYKCSLALSPRLFALWPERFGFDVTLLGIRLHFQHMTGGYYV